MSINDIYLKKLDDIIKLLRLIAKENIQRVINEIKQDPVKSKMVSIVEREQPISYSELIEIAIKETNLKRTSITQKISYLKNVGVLESKKEGKKTLYYLSDLISI